VTTLDMLLIAQAVSSGMMAGIIWFVQVVHYPLFAAVSGPEAAGYAPMLVEAAAAGWLAVAPPPAIGRGAALAGLVLVALLWLSTLAVQMPLHGRLAAEGHAAATVSALVRSNWPRTILWTARAVLAAWMLAAG